MTHPLTDFVKNLFTEQRVSIDRFDLAIAMGPPDGNPDAWGAFLQTADVILDCLAREGALFMRRNGWYPAFELNEPPIYKTPETIGRSA